VLQRKMKSRKYTILGLKWRKIHECSVLNDIFVMYGLMMRAKILHKFQIVCQGKLSEIPQSLTSLRLFVKENYLRSRRVSCATTKNEKSEIHNIMSEMKQNTRMQRVE